MQALAKLIHFHWRVRITLLRAPVSIAKITNGNIPRDREFERDKGISSSTKILRPMSPFSLPLFHHLAAKHFDGGFSGMEFCRGDEDYGP
jgi:hypothetical protein